MGIQIPAAAAYPFWREESHWPVFHYLVPLNLYAALGNGWAVGVFVFAWETLEQYLSKLPGLAGHFDEPRWDDSWAGDPLMGGLAALTFAAADATWGWRAAQGPGIWLRLLAFALQLGASAAILYLPDWKPSSARPELLLNAAASSAVVLAIYAPFWPDGMARTLAWLAVTWIVSVAGMPVLLAPTQPPAGIQPMGRRGQSVYARTFMLGLGLLILVLSGAAARAFTAP